MTKVLSHLKDIEASKWKELEKVSDFSSPFQTLAYYEVVKSTPGMDAAIFAVEEGDSYVAAVVITLLKESGLKSRFSARAIVHGGPLLLAGVDELFLKLLLKEVLLFSRKRCIYLEIRNYFDYSAYHSSFEEMTLSYVPWNNVKIPVIGKAENEKIISKSKLRQIKATQHYKYNWKATTSQYDVSLFYAELKIFYNSRVGKPLPPIEYFFALINKGLAELVVVSCSGTAVAGIFTMHSDKSVYEYYICNYAQDAQCVHKGVMAMRALIEYANEKGFKTIDLMGAGEADKPSSIRDFKMSFGGDLIEDGRYQCVFKPLLYKLGKNYINAQSH